MATTKKRIKSKASEGLRNPKASKEEQSKAEKELAEKRRNSDLATRAGLQI